MPDQARELHRQGRLDVALGAYDKALQTHPSDPRLRHDYGLALMQSGRFHDAVAQLQQVLAALPQAQESRLLLALCLRALGAHDAALAQARHLPAQGPYAAVVALVIGSSQVALGAAAAGEPALRRAVALEPANAEAWHWLGQALQAQGRWSEAAQAYRHSLSANPDELANLALCAEQAGELDQARQAYAQMCQRHPRRADLHLRLAHVQAQMCLLADEAATTQTLEGLLTGDQPLAPEDRPEAFPLSYLRLSMPARLRALSRYRERIQAKVAAWTAPADGASDADSATAVNAADAASAAASQTASAAPAAQAASQPATITATITATAQAATDDQRIRIGYLSPDFGDHAVGRLLAGHFAAHDASRFAVYGYSLRRHAGAVAEAISNGCDVYRDCSGLDSQAVAARIRADGIQVLIDLGGYTHGARPEIAALRPAPRQFTWLGFIHGMDAPWFDGNLLDAGVQPENADWPFREPALILPGTLFPAGPLPAGQPDRAGFGLPAGRFLFASFNNSYKLDRPLLAAWQQILAQVPHADLVLYLPGHARAGFLAAWRELGADPARLHLAERLPFDQQADRAASCDLFLDAFRYQAGSTGMAAIAAGLPVLCRAGQTPLARLSVSLNRFLGLDELVCADTDSYIRRAVALADAGAIDSLKQRLRMASHDTGLFDPRRAARAIEALIVEIIGPQH